MYATRSDDFAEQNDASAFAAQKIMNSMYLI